MKIEEYQAIASRLKAEYEAAKAKARGCDGMLLRDKYLAIAEAWQAAREIVLEVADAESRITSGVINPEWDHANTMPPND